MKAFEFEQILNVVLSSFNIRYVDFNQDQFRCYKERRIGGVARIDTGEIMIDKNLSEAERDRTWVHEILSVYYYLNGILRHDEEIEREAQSICDGHQKYLILKRHQR